MFWKPHTQLQISLLDMQFVRAVLLFLLLWDLWVLLRDSLLLLPLKQLRCCGGTEGWWDTINLRNIYIYIHTHTHYVNTRFLWFPIIFCQTKYSHLVSEKISYFTILKTNYISFYNTPSGGATLGRRGPWAPPNFWKKNE